MQSHLHAVLSVDHPQPQHASMELAGTQNSHHLHDGSELRARPVTMYTESCSCAPLLPSMHVQRELDEDVRSSGEVRHYLALNRHAATHSHHHSVVHVRWLAW